MNNTIINQSTNLYREEHKYYISPAKAMELKHKLSRLLAKDSFDNGNGYKVKSLYFDTPLNNDFYETVDGLHTRQKLRLRIYDENSQTVKLECKQKKNSKQRKTTITISKDEALELCRGNCSFLLDYKLEEALDIYIIASKGYRPVAIVEYNRTAFTWPNNNTRITFDSNVSVCFTCLDLFEKNLPYVPALGNETVLEVKYNKNLEPFLKNELAGYCDSRQSISKYANSRLAGAWLI